MLSINQLYQSETAVATQTASENYRYHQHHHFQKSFARFEYKNYTTYNVKYLIYFHIFVICIKYMNKKTNVRTGIPLIP